MSHVGVSGERGSDDLDMSSLMVIPILALGEKTSPLGKRGESPGREFCLVSEVATVADNLG